LLFLTHSLITSLAIASCYIDKSYLVDVVTKLYIATDSNPVDVKTYELCSDLVDVVIDVSYIYGINTADGENQGAPVPYDDNSTSAIRLNSGMILYLKEVSNYLALVCVMREEHFQRRAVLDYNINCFKDSLKKIIDEIPDNDIHL